MAIRTETLVLTPLSENCTILWDPDAPGDAARECVVVDPGGDAPRIASELARLGLACRLILITHGHSDHAGAAAPLRAATGAPIAVHPLDAERLGSKLLSGATWLDLEFEEHTPDLLLTTGTAAIGVPNHPTLVFDVAHTPGHCPGHVTFHLPAAGILVGGDLVFRGGVGRTDLPGGDPAALDESIRRHFLTLPDETRVLPGHGPETTVGRERRSNAFVAPLAAGG